MIKILIADDHEMFVDGITSILSGVKGIQVVASCFDGTSVFKILYEKEIDVILLDLNLPGMSGIDVAKRISKEHPKVKILALSMYNEHSYIKEITKFGALGYILKNTGHKELIRAIKTVYEGEKYFSEAVMNTIMNGMLHKKNRRKLGSLLLPKLSRREKEVLELIVKEYTNQEIADQLIIGTKTVESHRRSLLSKLNVRNTAGLVRIALEKELLD